MFLAFHVGKGHGKDMSNILGMNSEEEEEELKTEQKKGLFSLTFFIFIVE